MYAPGSTIVLKAGSVEDKDHSPHIEDIPAESVNGLHSLER